MTAAGWLTIYMIQSSLAYAAVLLLSRTTANPRALQAMWRTAAVFPLFSATLSASLGVGICNIRLHGRFPEFLALNNRRPGLHSPAANIALLTYGVVVAALISRDFIARRIFVARLCRRRLDDDKIRRILGELLCSAGVNRVVRLTQSDVLASPIALGLGEICIAARATRDLSTREMRCLLAHELAHLLRGDTAWFCAMACIEHLLFFQPLHRAARRELQFLSESACDSWAADVVSDREAMAWCIIKIAGRMKPIHATLPAAARGDVMRRITALIEKDPAPARCGLWSIPFVAARVLVLCLIPWIVFTPKTRPRHAHPTEVSPSQSHGEVQ